MAHWFPSIERPFGPAPIGMPSLLYCHSRPRDRKTRICGPGEIWFARLGTRDRNGRTRIEGAHVEHELNRSHKARLGKGRCES
jgi:hypothetical protein